MGKLRSGQYGIERDFGRDYSNFREDEFIAYVKAISYPGVVDGGLFMPLLIRKEHFQAVGGCPEGIAPGEPCILGFEVLNRKLQSRGIQQQHLTVLSTIFNLENPILLELINPL